MSDIPSTTLNDAAPPASADAPAPLPVEPDSEVSFMSESSDVDANSNGKSDGSESPPSDKDENSDDFEILSKPEEADEEADKKLRSESYKIMAEVGNFGLFLVIALIFTYVIGRWMDNLFGTKPVFTIFWIVCGIASSIMELAKSLKKAKKLAEDDKTDAKTD